MHAVCAPSASSAESVTDVWVQARALQVGQKLDNRRAILQSLASSSTDWTLPAWDAVIPEAIDILPILLAEDSATACSVCARDSVAHSLGLLRVILIMHATDNTVGLTLLHSFATKCPSLPLPLPESLAALLSVFEQESLQQDTKRKQTLLALHEFLLLAVKSQPDMIVIFRSTPDLQSALCASIMPLLARTIARERSPSVTQCIRKLGSDLASLMPADAWLPKQIAQLRLVDPGAVTESDISNHALLPAVLSGLQSHVPQVAQLYDVIITKLSVPTLFALIEEDAVYAPEKVSAYQPAQRRWYSWSEILLASLYELLRHYESAPECPPTGSALVVCAALASPSCPWSNSTTASAAVDAIRQMARTRHHGDMQAYLSKELMPALRVLDTLFKDKASDTNSGNSSPSSISSVTCIPSNQPWHRPSAFVHALQYLTLLLKQQHPHAGAYMNPLVSLILRALDTHETPNKLMAVRMLAHLLAEVDESQVRWHGELLFQTLKRQLVYRDADIIQPLLPAITRCVLILEVESGGPRNMELFLEILKELEWSMKRELVPHYLAQLPALIQRNGIHVIRYFSRLFPALLALFRCASKPSALALIEACHALLTYCWPRMHTRIKEIKAALSDLRMAGTATATDSEVITASLALSIRLDAFPVSNAPQDVSVIQ